MLKRHRLKKILAQHLVPDSGGYWDYDVWTLYEEPETYSLIIDLLYELIKKEKGRFDLIGGLGGSGTPLAVGLAAKIMQNKSYWGSTKKWFIIRPPYVAPASKWLSKFKPSNIELEGKKILIVDSDIKTGQSVWDAHEKIKTGKGIVKTVIAINNYSTFKNRDFLRKNEIRKIKKISLFNFDPNHENEARQVDNKTKLSWFKDV